ncbi:MAG: serine/threonine protein kinase [Actinoallomurus sp.]|nr:serine/threonine protein kinase [Actinoallomurus sp.]
MLALRHWGNSYVVDTPRLLKNRYRLGTVIGRGGMGIVWLATDELLDRKVAVKEVSFPPGLPAEEREKLRRRTLREARTTARLSHPNVVGLYDIVEDEDRPWIVMEFVPSRSLSETLRGDGPLTPERAAEIGLQLLEALRAAHAAGVLHRDVKPSNVLLGEDGRVVLGDFGIATAEGGSTVTSSGVLIGSPSYMAPERARGNRAGPESDLWSLGATLYTAVEGQPPFGRDNAVATLAAVVTEDPDPPRRAGPLWPLISGLLARDPSERPDPATVELMLRAVGDGSQEVPPASPPDEAAEEPLKRAERTQAIRVPRPRPAPDDAALDSAAPGSTAPGSKISGISGSEALDGGEPGSRAPDHPASGLPVAARPAAARASWFRPWRAATLLVVAAAVLGAVGWGLFGAGHATSKAPARKATPPAHRAGTAPHQSASAPSASSSPSPADGGFGTLPSGYHWYHDRTKFSIAVPNGWSVSHKGHYVYIEDPKSSRYLIVDQSDSPKSDPLADWREQEANRIGSYPGYHRIRLESVHYAQAQKAADWEFTYNGSRGRTHILNRNILANSSHAYALYWSSPDSTWSSSRSVFDTFASSFRPATG